ncbi:MAG: hypothetical protein FWD12_01590 [Alphaproteobacteria bacterium]|nr:hypothetical protein [Alphaproteobacteria bacterium]
MAERVFDVPIFLSTPAHRKAGRPTSARDRSWAAIGHDKQDGDFAILDRDTERDAGMTDQPASTGANE